MRRQSTVGEGVNGVVGLRGYLTWARDCTPASSAGDPTFGQGGRLPHPGPGALLNEYPALGAGQFAQASVGFILARNELELDDARRPLLPALARARPGSDRPVAELKAALPVHRRLHGDAPARRGSPGISKQDFLDWFAPERDQRVLEKLQASKRWMTANRDNEQALELIQSSLRFGPGALRVLSMLREREAQGPLAHDEAAPTGAAASAPTSSSIEDVVMAPAPTAAPASKGKAVAKPPSRRRPAPPAPAATGARPTTSPSLAATPEHAAVTSLAASAGAGADLAAAVARTGRSPATSPQHSPSVAAPAPTAAAPPAPAPAALPARVPGRKRHATDAAGASSSGQTSSLLSSIFGGGEPAAPPAAAPTAAPSSNPLPSPSPSAASDEGASTGTGSSGGRSRVRRPRDGR